MGQRGEQVQRLGGGREPGLRQGERWGDRGRVSKETSDKVPGGRCGEDWALWLSEMGSQRQV